MAKNISLMEKRFKSMLADFWNLKKNDDNTRELRGQKLFKLVNSVHENGT